jgi:small subunit ribosomal protein S15
MDEEEDDTPIDFDIDIDEPAEDVDFILEEGELDEDDDEVGADDDGELPGWAVSAERTKELRLQYRLHETDTGSPEYQVAGMTERVRYLTTHLQEHPKDFSTRRGLVALVNKRRRLLNYLFKENVERYKSLITSLGLRHKAPGSVPTREEKYSRFPRQKSTKKHLINKKNESKA